MSNCLTLKKSNCKNCYKCIRNCPVKAIRFSGNQAHIIGNECILGTNNEALSAKDTFISYNMRLVP